MDLLSETKKELKALISSMNEEELLDSQFQQVQNLQDERNPNLVAEVITLFLNSAETTINLLGQYLSQIDDKFPEMYHQVHQIKGSSSSIGANKINLASIDLREAVEARNKEMCMVALTQIQREYIIIREKFAKVVHLENKIFAIKRNQILHHDVPMEQA